LLFQGGGEGKERSFYSISEVTCFRVLMDSLEGELKAAASVVPIRNKFNGTSPTASRGAGGTTWQDSPEGYKELVARVG